MVTLAYLHSDEASIVLEPRENAAPAWRHCGARVDPAGVPPLSAARGPASFSVDRDVPLSTAPGTQPGWFGRPHAMLHDHHGAALNFRPSASIVDQDAQNIRITLSDEAQGAAIEQEFQLMQGGAFRLRTRLTNQSDQILTITDACSAILPLHGDWAKIVSWSGRHNAELAEQVEEMPAQGWLRETRRGISGHGGPPGVYLLARGATRDAGLVLSLQLAWSGDSRIAIDRDDEGYWVLSAAVTGTRAIAPGETAELPDAILAISTRGRNGAMAQQHAAVRSLLDWPGGAMRPRRVHLNSWEACYFDHDEDRIVRLAQSAAAIGAERFVLDDGWFKGRRSDNAGLGDWTADPVKYPRGLGPLIEKVTALGLEFGLWVEPEMINPDSDLYRAHPDWTLAEAGGETITSRNQLVLDMRRGDVRDYLFGAIDKLLAEHPVTYLKWDHNRDHAPAGGPAQVLGTYDLLARVRAAHPGVEIEGCAGGGGRSDAGLARHVHRFWTSDNVDAISRIGMQRGFLAFLPPEIMGAHIGASPCHATGRSQSLPYRAAIACMGHLGVEMDPAALDDAEREEISGWLGFYKQWRGLLHGGTVMLGDAADQIVWQAQGQDGGGGGEFLLFVIRSSPARHRRPQPLPLPFAAVCDTWNVRLLKLAETSGPHCPAQPDLVDQYLNEGVVLTGSWLAANGLPLPVQQAESVAIFHLEAAR